MDSLVNLLLLQMCIIVNTNIGRTKMACAFKCCHITRVLCGKQKKRFCEKKKQKKKRKLMLTVMFPFAMQRI